MFATAMRRVLVLTSAVLIATSVTRASADSTVDKTDCKVNGVAAAVVDGVVKGTAEKDIIECVGVAKGDLVRGFAGDDQISLVTDGRNAGTINGGPGSDMFNFGAKSVVEEGGTVNGGLGNDHFDFHDTLIAKGGTFNAGPGNDRGKFSGEQSRHDGVIDLGEGDDYITAQYHVEGQGLVDGGAGYDYCSGAISPSNHKSCGARP